MLFLVLGIPLPTRQPRLEAANTECVSQAIVLLCGYLYGNTICVLGARARLTGVLGDDAVRRCRGLACI